MLSQINHHFFQYLITEGIVTEERLSQIIEKAKHQQASFISCLINEENIDIPRLLTGLAQVFGLSVIDLDTIDVSQLPSHLIEGRLLQKYQVLPLWQEKEKLGLAITDPTQQLAIDDISFHTGFIIEKILVTPEKLKRLLEKVTKKSAENAVSFISGKQENRLMLADSKLNAHTAKNTESEIAVIQMVSQLLQLAIERGASDIHIESYQDHLQVRFRIDGLLYLATTFPVSLIQRIITRLKIMSQLDIAERRLPQDGRFQVMDAGNRPIDCRINSCPTLYGEKLVIRILDSNKMLLKVDKLGMNEAQKRCFFQALQTPHGMLLVTGPTGSGKTITLYTALNFLNTSLRNISSVENPVEIVLPGINQVNINPKIGLNFAKILRAFLRQDPDVMMVGEMRDQETAEIGIKAAQTGHLVLSSLHTNSAAESLVRLVNMGIPSYNVASALHLIIAQRLARRLCRHCKIKDELPNSVLYSLGLSQEEMKSTSFFAAQGCDKCTDGYRGRTGIFELLLVSDQIKSLILKDYAAQEIALQAQAGGMQTLYTSALEKLKQGEISLLEMKRIIKD
jgi:type IV pilus assembly protein PilB